jgi:hypothetical protein
MSTSGATPAASTPGPRLLPRLLEALPLDPLTVVDDDRFVGTLAKEKNLPKEVADNVLDLF